MEASIILLCKYGSFTVVLTVTRDFRFDDLVQSICQKWQDLELKRFQLLYAVSDHHNCHLDNDVDFANMFALAGAYGVSCVDVGVEVLSSCSVESGELEIGESSIVHGVEEDPFENFSPHHETIRLSSGWAKLISHGGQKFRGGVDDLRSCLAKFAIEVGFVYTFSKNDKTRVTVVCSKKGESGSEWFIHATLNRANGFFRISDFVKEHNCVSVFASSKNPRMSTRLVAQEIREEVRRLFSVAFGIVDSEDDQNICCVKKHPTITFQQSNSNIRPTQFVPTAVSKQVKLSTKFCTKTNERKEFQSDFQSCQLLCTLEKIFSLDSLGALWSSSLQVTKILVDRSRRRSPNEL
ncbi:hypothetical protein Vadar_016729 [Vaccinium darrowii]|uniref:Uncharacterized protein n=1 Tax=Vaccinium darrowii TaxID=229202 RepID=A0ACB7ZKZ3_9ERIC|nr:hypothetical protein Vadar_016729 [Vaccinium darrowii]